MWLLLSLQSSITDRLSRDSVCVCVCVSVWVGVYVSESVCFCVFFCASMYVCVHVWRRLNRPLLGSLCFYIIHHPSVQDTHIHTGMLTKEGRRGMTTVKSDRRGDRRALPADQLGDGRPAKHTHRRTDRRFRFDTDTQETSSTEERLNYRWPHKQIWHQNEEQYKRGGDQSASSFTENRLVDVSENG